MLKCYLLLCFGLSHESLTSKNLQKQISEDFFNPKDLLKADLVDKTWIKVGNLFKKITPKAGLFQRKRTNEIILQTEENSWNDTELAQEFCAWQSKFYWHLFHTSIPEDEVISPDDIQEKNWVKIFFKVLWLYIRCKNKVGFNFLKALAEIIDVHEVNSSVELRRTPLHHAAQSGEVDLIYILLDNGAEIEALDDDLLTPLMCAVCMRQKEAVQTLLSRGANVNHKEIGGSTSLHLGFFPQGDITQILLENGADVNATDNNLNTPLMIVLRWPNRCRCVFVKALLSNGANPMMKNKQGQTAVNFAKIYHKCKNCQLRLICAILGRRRKSDYL